MATIAGILVDIGADLSDLKKGLSEANSKLDDFAKNVSKSTKSQEDGFSKLGKSIGAAFAVDKLLEFGKKIIDVTGQFEKLGAVLSNSLGSQSAGQAAFAQIQSFAAKTNFSVLEVADSFTLLANRGIRPTEQNLTSLADVANALGKPLNDVVQAVLDVTNTERWNELGIKVAKAGDTITATFRGQTVSAKATEQGALDLVTAIGKFEGVAGVTAAVSETLQGKLSNLGDAFDRFLNSIGTKSSPAFKGFAQVATDALNAVGDALERNEDRGKRLSSGATATALGGIEERFKKLAQATRTSGGDNNAIGFTLGAAASSSIEEFTAKLNAAKLELKDAQNNYFKPQNAFNKELADTFDRANNKVAYYTSIIGQIPDVQTKVISAFKQTIVASEGLIAGLEKQIKAQKEANEAATDTGTLSAGQAALKNLNDQIEALKKLGTQNSLEIVTDKLEKYYGILSNPDATNAAVANAAKEVRALETVRDALQNNIDARVSNNLVPQDLQNLQPTSRGQQPLQGITDTSGIKSISTAALDAQKPVKTLFDNLMEVNAAMGPNQLSTAQISAMANAWDDFGNRFEQAGGMIVDLSGAITSAIAGMAEGIGSSIAAAITGVGDFGSFFGVIIEQVAQFGKTLGGLLVAQGVAALAAKALISNPWTAIIGGAALIAASTIALSLFKNAPGGKAKAFAAGGLVYGPTMGLVGEGSGTSRRNPEVIAPLDKLKSFMGGGMGQVEFVIQGETLKGVLRNYDRGADRRG